MTEDQTPRAGAGSAGDVREPGEPFAWMRVVGREVLLPIGVVIGALLIAVALVEGPALDQFLYAIF